ncbi:unnamed protein product [Adineta steineri]|uniref:Transmembrane protein n=1 Tax=Adineta steineri TaxID=433720 RepID=A0A813Y800_9BILA|nr:unnamed protein product [Adineta steineri]CAF0822369.1 unnamed protein product [Adineta steineri]CAF0880004.1 unnamed protein product [Adineta steineri]CAF3910181.1 unnamed protein product [Adineta steineri]CAF3933031.1 unnamed protein product [Adineta steineri]
MASNSAYADLVDRPLFGETRSRDRISFMIITAATFVGMFLFRHISSTHIFLNICLLLLLASHLCLAFWYRSGDLEPRFRNMLFFNTAIIILLCICANLIISGK